MNEGITADCRVIKVEGLPIKALLKYTTISISSRNEFVELATDPKFNLSAGSYFQDDQKAYFFNGFLMNPLCFMYTKGDADGR